MSVRLPVCDVRDCDHKCNKKWKKVHDSIGLCLGYLHAEADPDRTIL